MKIELVSYFAGGLALEVIAENEIEVTLLQHAWRTMQGVDRPRQGNGKTATGVGSMGFYLPVTPAHVDAAREGGEEQ